MASFLWRKNREVKKGIFTTWKQKANNTLQSRGKY